MKWWKGKKKKKKKKRKKERDEVMMSGLGRRRANKIKEQSKKEV